MAKWIEYTGSDEQINEMCKPGCRYAFMDDNGKVLGPYIWLDTSNHPDQRLRELSDLKSQLDNDSVKKYLICDPHPYADLIKIWADTECPVWVRPPKPYEFKISDYENNTKTRLMTDWKGAYLITTEPDWDIPGAEYRLTPFED